MGGANRCATNWQTFPPGNRTINQTHFPFRQCHDPCYLHLQVFDIIQVMTRGGPGNKTLV